MRVAGVLETVETERDERYAGPKAPAIETERLTMRGHTLADFDECLAMWTDPVVMRYLGGRPLTIEETWARLLRYAGSWALLGFGYWVVRERATGRFVGEVGLADLRRDIVPRLDGVPEAGWVLATWSQGSGYATEAVQAALEWGDTNLGSARTVCIIAPGNTASIRVAEKCGFTEAGHATFRGEDTLVLERLADRRFAEATRAKPSGAPIP